MKKFMKHSLFLLLCSAVFVTRMHAVSAVVPNTGGGASSGSTFQEVAQAAAFHRPSGTMVFGLGKAASMDALGFASNTVTAASAGSHAMLDTLPTYTGIAQTALAAGLMNIQNSSIQALAIANDITSPENFSKAKIFFISSQGNDDSLATSDVGHPLMVITTTAIPSNPNALKLKDADGTTTCYTMTVVAGNAYGTASKTYACAAVKASGAHDANRGNFGYHQYDGVALVECGEDDYTLTQRDQEASQCTVLTTSLAIGKALDTNVQLGENGRAPAMCYDERLKRLYVGVNYTTSLTPSNNTGGWGVQIFQVDPDTSNGTLTNLAQGGVTTPGSKDGGAVVLTGSHIVGVGGGGSSTAGTRASLTYHNLKVMHTSTGPSDGTKFAYLIVNGGNGHGGSTAIAGSSAVSNRVWSVPLVVGNRTSDTSDNVIDGTFANVKTGNYKTVADAAGELFLTNTAAVRVGNGPLPCPASTKPSAMWVDGDAVYCSIDAAASNTCSPGIWHSQACFNRHGQIDHWTEWQRVAPPFLGGDAQTTADILDNGGRISFFAVDAISSRIWGVDTSKTRLRLSTWASASYLADRTAPLTADSTGLITCLNSSSNLNNNCTAICDLNSSTTGWGATTPTRLTMFGNKDGKVSFAITGSAVGSSGTNVTHSAGKLLSTNTAVVHNIVFDYSTTGTLKTTTVASGKNVRCLAYSGWDERASSLTTGYFFAGVEDTANPGTGGLYVWTLASLGAGFDTRDVHDLNMPPFRGTSDTSVSPRSWQQLTRISGVPSKIVAHGGAIYILTHGHDKETPDRIFRLTRKSTAAALNTDFCVTASAGKAGTDGTSTGNTLPSRIYDFAITVTAISSETSGAQGVSGTVYGEQLMMLTNDGIWTTTCAIGTDDYNVGRNPNNAQYLCGWVQMSSPSTDNTFQITLDEPAYTRDPSTFWFNRIVEHKDKPGVYFAVDIHQINRRPLSVVRGSQINDGATWGNWAYNPSVYNGYDGSSTEPTLFDQEPPIMGFYSDGSRRIVQKYRSTIADGNTANLYGQPYEVHSKWWNNQGPHSHLIYNPGSTAAPSYLHAISNAGSTGKLLIGTDGGVKGLV